MKKPTAGQYRNFLHDRNLAEKRLAENGREIKTISDLILSPENFGTAQQMHDQEARIVFSSGTLSEKGIFHGVIYCLLTSLQDYETQIQMFEKFSEGGFDGPSPLLENFEEVENIFRKLNFRNQKMGYIRQLCESWHNIHLFEQISEELGNGRNREIELREGIMKKVPGLGEKTTSLLLRMCGSESLVPIDSWMNEILYLHGYPLKIARASVTRPDEGKTKKRKRAITGSKYIQAEDFALELAEKYSVPGGLLQLAYWTKHSSFKRT